MLATRYTIGAKIFGAFVAMSLIIGALGVTGYAVLAAAGQIAVTTFDGPLMAISYARAAHTDFAEMQTAELQLQGAAPADRAALSAEIDELTDAFDGDLQVAAERATAEDEQSLIRGIARDVRQWKLMRRRDDRATLKRLDSKIDGRFDMLTELITDHGFVSRHQTIASVSLFKYASIAATMLALMLAAALTWLLRSRIVRPLRAAAAVADRIAKGEMQTAIPSGGADETGALLNSMTVMQDSIRGMMARETMLRQSAENRLADALETSREGVILVAPDGHIVLANGTLRDFFPVIADSLTSGMHFETVLRLIQGQLAAPAAAIDPRAQSELHLTDGRWLRLTGSATSEGGSIIFLSDITAIKEREEKLRRATREAEAANAAKSRFLANMSHELRTPLNAIIGFSEIMTGELFGALGSPKYLDYSHDILRSGRHLLAVINDVLDLSKSEAGKLNLDGRPLEMGAVLQDCATMVREQCAQAGLTLVLEGLDSPLPLTGDAAKLRQIFLNLLSNAVKFTEKGGTVTLTAAAAASGISVTVADTGIGMSPEDIEIAFQPFGQVDNRLERRYEGTGLGLPLTRSLVELHGGNLRIESALGRGTRVIVFLPCAFRNLAEAI